jgi:hypothetical protein
MEWQQNRLSSVTVTLPTETEFYGASDIGSARPNGEPGRTGAE